MSMMPVVACARVLERHPDDPNCQWVLHPPVTEAQAWALLAALGLLGAALVWVLREPGPPRPIPFTQLAWRLMKSERRRAPEGGRSDPREDLR